MLVSVERKRIDPTSWIDVWICAAVLPIFVLDARFPWHPAQFCAYSSAPVTAGFTTGFVLGLSEDVGEVGAEFDGFVA